MRIFYSDHHEVALPDGHRFPMAKYAALRAALVAAPFADPWTFTPTESIATDALLRVHDADYVHSILNGTLAVAAVRRIGFPWSDALVRRTLASVAGTVSAAHEALAAGRSANLAGGTHHASRASGSGFCVFNDLAVAAASVLDARPSTRVLVFDADVHQGDGTASIFADEPRVFTCSIHGEKNFPFQKQISDLDIALADGTGDQAFVDAVDDALTRSIERARPDLVLFQAGVDALESDRLGRLAVSHAGLAARDRLVFETARRRGLAVAWTLGGGYADPIEDSIHAHLATYRVAAEVFGDAVSR